MKMLKALPHIIKAGLFDCNPLFFRCALLCPALVAAHSPELGLRLGFTATLALTLTGICSPLVRRISHERVHFLCDAILAAFFVTLADLTLRAYLPGFSAAMGVFIPLLAVGCLTLCLPGGFTSDGGEIACGLKGLFMGLGATLALCAAGVLHELLAHGMFGNYALLGDDYPGAMFFDSPAGVFIALGLAAGLFRLAARAASACSARISRAKSKRRPKPDAESADEGAVL